MRVSYTMMSAMVVAVVACFAICVSAQLNFSPGWGKRNSDDSMSLRSHHNSRSSSSGGVNAALPPPIRGLVDNCADMNRIAAVMHIYTLIKNEAARMIQCQDEDVN
ncbi:unnamed protein product [Meganyctiphanes norvegica]|uniref:Uncharacterized protein n=1 Tax=Meganyctiphanes norvegica TaxID=48144 RepID=A0AAV2QJ83_MEGNR